LFNIIKHKILVTDKASSTRRMEAIVSALEARAQDLANKYVRFSLRVDEMREAGNEEQALDLESWLVEFDQDRDDVAELLTTFKTMARATSGQVHHI